MTNRDRRRTFLPRATTLVLAALGTAWFWNRAREPALERRTRRRLAIRVGPIRGERT